MKCIGTPFALSGAGTNAGVTVTKAASGIKTHVLTGIQCSGDAAALVTVESPAGTILFRKRFTAAFNFSDTFATPLKGVSGQDLLIKISASTANSEANGQGYSV